MSDFILKIETTNPKITIPQDLAKFLVPGFLPQTIRELIFDNNFSAEIEPGVIPMGTEIVEFGKGFNQKLKPGVFPISVTCIIFKHYFSMSLENVLPENLKILYIGNDLYCHSQYKHQLDNILPPSITDFNLAVSDAIKNIPNRVTELYITNDMCCEYNFDIPVGVKKIYFSPKSVRYASNIFSLLKTRDITMILLSNGENLQISCQMTETYNISKIVDSEIIKKHILKTGMYEYYENLTFYSIAKKQDDNQLQKIDQLSTENIQLKTEIDQLKISTHNDMKEKIIELTVVITEMNQLKIENDQLKTEISQLKTSTHDDMKEKIIKLMAAITEINQF